VEKTIFEFLHLHRALIAEKLWYISLMKKIQYYIHAFIIFIIILSNCHPT